MSTHKQKDFSVMKWLIFPFIALGCAIGIGYTSVNMFGLEGSVLYLILLACIVAIGLILVLQTGNKALPQAIRAAFIFESVGLAALLITCIICVYVSRGVAGHKEATQTATEQIKEIGKLKSRSAQKQLAGTIHSGNIAEAYQDAEKYLLWALCFECGVYFIGLIVVFGINIFCHAPDAPIYTEYTMPEIESKNKKAKLSLSPSKAAFTAPTREYASISNGVQSFRFRPIKGNSAQLQLSWRNGRKELFCATVDESEARKLAKRDYQAVAAFAIAEMKKSGKDTSPIETTI